MVLSRELAECYLLNFLLAFLHLVLELLQGIWVTVLQFAAVLPAARQLLLFAGRVVRLLRRLHLCGSSLVELNRLENLI